MNEHKIKKAFERQTPDVLGQVLAQCEQPESNDGWQVVKQPKKSRPWIGALCTAAVLAIVISLGTFVLRRAPQAHSGDPTSPSANTDPSEYVVDAYRGSWNGYEYAIPKLTLTSAYAQTVNAEIERSYQRDEDSIVREEQNFSYETFVTGDILSLVYYVSDRPAVYTVNLRDGSEATREDVLAQAGVSTEEYLKRVDWDLANTYCNSADNWIDLNFLTSDAELDSAKPFLCEEGLCYLARIHYGNTVERQIFRYSEPVEEADSYRRILKSEGSPSSLIYMSEIGTYTNSDGAKQSWYVPLVLIEGDYSAEVNREIQALCELYLDANGNRISTAEIDYHCFVAYEGVLSLSIQIEDDGHFIHRGYNFNIDDGSKLDTAEMLALFDITEEQFRTNARHQLAAAYCETMQEDLSQIEAVSPEFMKTVSDENIDSIVPVIFDTHPGAYGTVYTPNGEQYLFFSVSDDSACNNPTVHKMLELAQIHLPNQAITPVDPDNPVVEAYSKTKPYTFEGKELLYSCSVPEIRCNSDYAKSVNQELVDYYNSTFDSAGNWLGANMSYEWHINGDILSLIVYLFDTEYTTYLETGWPNRVYNIRMSDGREASTDEILQTAGVSKEDFYARVREFLGSYFLYFAGSLTWEEILEDPQAHAEDIHLAHFKVTVGEENLDRAIPYFTENGELHFTGRVYSPIGGYAVETPLSSRYENFEISPYYEDMLRLCEE